MFQTMTQIGKTYAIDAKTVGQILYELDLRDRNHPEQPGFPHEQVIIHGIAKAFKGRTGDVYYKYDIERIKEEFEAKVQHKRAISSDQAPAAQPITQHEQYPATILHNMLTTLNHAIQNGDFGDLYKLKANIADLYALENHRSH